MKKIVSVLVSILIYQTISYTQVKTSEENINTISSLSLLIESGVTFARTDYSGTGTDIIARISAEYKFPSSTRSSFGLKLWGGGGYLTGSDNSKSIKNFRTGFKTFGLGMLYGLNLSQNTSTYLMAGLSLFSFNPKGENGVELPNNAAGKYNTNEIDYNGELGIRFGITDNLKFVLSTGINFSTSDNYDDITAGLKNDFFITTMAGLSFTLSNKKDDDKDGVEDSEDMCPNTPEGVKVNEFGCPVDTDGDGIADYLDKCPNTPKDVKIDKYGCPLDSDKDGVPDYSDLCSDTPPGISVDAYGCPFDLDADGVPDYKDKCPNTPAGITIDSKGCPLDSDLDGIPDYKDNCPGTQHGMIVDSNGCVKIKIQKQKKKIKIRKPAEKKVKIRRPIKKKEKIIKSVKNKNEIIKTKKQKLVAKLKPKTKSVKKIVNRKNKKNKIDFDNFTLSGENIFETGKSELLPGAYPYLDALISYMKKNLFSRWRIEGYTDNVGSSKRNKILSLERAKSVLNYFVKKGIVKQRFKVVGLGKSFPIASNKTKRGRARNRRVVIVRTY